MKRPLPPLLAAALLASGCMTPPPREDPFVGLSAPEPASQGAPAFENLTAAWILSGNTKNTLAYLQKFSARWGDAEEYVVGGAKAALRRDFKELTPIAGLQEAKGSGADLVVLLDVVAKIPTTMNGEVEFEAAAHFLTTDNQPIEELRVTAAHRMNAPSKKVIFMSLATVLTSDVMKLAAADAWAALDKAMRASAKLAEFARARREAKPAVAQSAATGDEVQRMVDKAVQAAVNIPKESPAAPPVSSDVDAPAYRLPERDGHFAVVVGVEKYANELPEAQFAEREAGPGGQLRTGRSSRTQR